MNSNAFANLRAHCESDAEPDTRAFRPSRGVGANADKFTVFEKYLSREAFQALKDGAGAAAFHVESKGIIASMEIFECYEEIAPRSLEVDRKTHRHI